MSERFPELQSASQGRGPLYQRDYWTVIRNCRLKPSEVIRLVSLRFAEFVPESLCAFTRGPGQRPDASLRPGDLLDIRIRMAGRCRVRVMQAGHCSLSFATMRGHPEAGKITFGAYRNSRRDVIFHIRSRARSGSGPAYAGFLAMGDPMQINTWTEFVNRVALTAGAGPLKRIHAETARLGPREAEAFDSDPDEAPTYLAVGD